MEFSTILYKLDENGIATVTINRPDKLNALNTTVMAELSDCFTHIAQDDAVKAVLLTGAGPKSFVAGADISQFALLNAQDGQKFAARGQAIFSQIEDLRKPVVAAVNGFALGGGCELALACHMRVASETARFGQPEVNLGILPGYGGTQRLPRLVGRGIAIEMILTGDMVSAQRAYEIGLVNKVAPADELIAVATKMLATIVAKAPIAVQYSLDAIYMADLPLAQGMTYEAVLFGQACATEDLKEGATAFLERRPADFKGK